MNTCIYTSFTVRSIRQCMTDSGDQSDGLLMRDAATRGEKRKKVVSGV